MALICKPMKDVNVVLERNKYLKTFFGFLVVANTMLFLVMAYLHLLSTDAKSAVLSIFGEGLLFIHFGLLGLYCM